MKLHEFSAVGETYGEFSLKFLKCAFLNMDN